MHLGDFMNDNYDLKNIIKFILIVSVIALLFYFITVVVLKNKKSETYDISSEPAVIQYNEIIIGDMFNQKESEYYVLLKENEDFYLDLYDTYISTYTGKENSLKVYTVDLSNAFNKKYLAEENNLDKENFKIKSTALIKINNKNIVETYEDNNSIIEALKLLQ